MAFPFQNIKYRSWIYRLGRGDPQKFPFPPHLKLYFHPDISGKDLPEEAGTSLITALQAVTDDRLLDQATAIVKTLTKPS
jgi:hypothetical protein